MLHLVDFSLPCPSIFDTSEEIRRKYGLRAVRPLAPKTMERIARGLKKFVIANKEPFIVQVNHSGAKGDYCNSMNDPLKVITAKHGFGIVEPVLAPYMGTNTTNHPGGDCKDPLHTITTGNQQCLISPTLIQYHSETSGKEVRGQCIDQPIRTLDGSNRYGLVISFLHKYYAGGYKGCGTSIQNPLPTVTAWDHNSIVATTLIQMNNHCDGRDIMDPLPTITAGDGHFAEVRAFLVKYYRNDPIVDISGIVTIQGVDYQIVDIGLRMLEPKELYGCQGFPDDYIIDHDFEGHTYPRSEQVRRCGNAVCPPIPAALVHSNLPEMCIAERMPNITKETVEEENGQLKFA